MRVTTLQWAVGMFSALLGAMMLIVPHRFEASTYAALQPHLLWWGVAFLLAGGGLLAAALSPLGWLVLCTHLAAGMVLLVLAPGFASQGAWARATNYVVLGLGTACVPLIARRRETETVESGGDLLALLVGLGAALTGLVIMAMPGQLSGRFYGLIRPHLPLYGGALMVTGLALAVGQFRPPSSPIIKWTLYLAVGSTLLAFAGNTAVAVGDWTGIAYYGGFGALVAMTPWLDPVLRHINSSSLRIRLALALIVAVAAPLIAAVTIVTDRDEQSATGQALTLQKTIAGTLADDISRYLSFHQAAASGIAKAINQVQMTAAQQATLLRSLGEEYPNVLSFATYDDHGHTIARGDSSPRESIGGSPVFEESLRNDGPSQAFQVSPGGNRLQFEFGAPLRRPDNSWAGVLVVSVESVRVATELQRVGSLTRGKAYVVDIEGRLVAHQDSALTGSFQDVSGSPPVAALLSGQNADGVLRYANHNGPQLAGFARVAGTVLGVVVERPLAVALAGAHTGREIAFTILLLMIVGAAVGGSFAAGALARPLEALAREAKRVGEDDATVALPESSIAEVKDLARTFGEMGSRLTARTQERERAYGALREREARIRSIMDSTSDGFIFVGRDGRVKSVNQRATELLPSGAAWAAGADFAPAVADIDVRPPEREALAATLRSLLEDRDPAGKGDLEVRGSGRVLHWDAQSAKDESGGTVGLTITLHDVTEEREVSRMKSDFVSFVTHQLRTPLAGIKWLLELAAETQDPGELQAYIQDARDANERLVNLVNDLLDISRLESGRLAVSLQELNLGAMTESVLEELGPLIKEKGHRFSVSGVERVPPVVADPQLLRQVVMNLVSNAIKYTPQPGEIVLEMRRENGSVQWAIQDNGIGVPKDAQPRLFEKFYRADNVHKIETEGTGLGLYLVRLIVERFGGRIWCESEEGKGSIFLFTVPLPGGKDTWTNPASGS